eukprot:scaffold4510_cov183-Amphora_coffeaeformis.AAC.90
MSSGGNLDNSGGKSSPEVWEQTLFFSAFASQIRSKVESKVHDATLGNGFSTTTATARVAHETTLRKRSDFFEESNRSTREAHDTRLCFYLDSSPTPRARPVCSELSGTRALRVLAIHGQTPSLRWLWRILANYWVGPNPLSISGQRQHPDQIPPTVSSAPVDWNYFCMTYDIHFGAVLVDCQQNPTDGTLSPVLGWYVTHALPSQSFECLAYIVDEIRALVKGHFEEASVHAMDRSLPWFVLVSMLFMVGHSIYSTLENKLVANVDEMKWKQGYYWRLKGRDAGSN